jgi:hypothetical protein
MARRLSGRRAAQVTLHAIASFSNCSVVSVLSAQTSRIMSIRVDALRVCTDIDAISVQAAR